MFKWDSLDFHEFFCIASINQHIDKNLKKDYTWKHILDQIDQWILQIIDLLLNEYNGKKW